MEACYRRPRFVFEPPNTITVDPSRLTAVTNRAVRDVSVIAEVLMRRRDVGTCTCATQKHCTLKYSFLTLTRVIYFVTKLDEKSMFSFAYITHNALPLRPVACMHRQRCGSTLALRSVRSAQTDHLPKLEVLTSRDSSSPSCIAFWDFESLRACWISFLFFLLLKDKHLGESGSEVAVSARQTSS